MKTVDVLTLATHHLKQLPGRSFNIFDIAKPKDLAEAVDLAQLYTIISKISPLVGNLIEHDTVDFLNAFPDYERNGVWKRQDPGFPDIIFSGNVQPTPGFEIKAWYPFSTEITGRFKDSQNHFEHDQTYVVLLAWLPEEVIYGNPKIIDMLIVPGSEIAKSRDSHYHKPPDYIVIEPQDTTDRTRNLQQTNTSGYKFQMSQEKLREAQAMVREWGDGALEYRPTPDYQNKLRELMENYTYRLDTNFAKMDRIVNNEVEAFKTRVLGTRLKNLRIRDWFRVLSRGGKEEIAAALRENLSLTTTQADQISEHLARNSPDRPQR